MRKRSNNQFKSEASHFVTQDDSPNNSKHAVASSDANVDVKPPSKWQKIFTRFTAGLVMAAFLYTLVFVLGHCAVAIFLVCLTAGIFNELVHVGHREANADRSLPLYRSLQWAWFFVAMGWAYGTDALKAPLYLSDEIKDWPLVGVVTSKLLNATVYHDYCFFGLYCAAFVTTVMCLQPEKVKAQLHILSFTVLSLSLFVIQLKMAVWNVFQGLFWFLFPLLLVAINDSFAYFAGYSMGKKIFKRPLISLSPSKTWEGFVGGAIATMVAGVFLPPVMVSPYLCCSYSDIYHHGLDNCAIPSHFMGNRTIGGFRVIQLHGLVLAAFASLVAPFGGFFASAIKRAYKLKDFGTLIPGHGGFMDRFDCQFLMASFTFIHLSTFLINEPSNLERAKDIALVLTAEQRVALINHLASLRGVTGIGSTVP